MNQLPDEYDPELGDVNNYIVAAIEREVYQTVEAESVVRIPHSTQYLATAKGKRIKPMTAAIVPMESFIGDDMEAIIDMRESDRLVLREREGS